MPPDKRSLTSAENGKKGGRPLSEATIKAQLARDYIAQQIADSLGAIVAKAITQAIEGDCRAREWLSDRAWGKSAQAHTLSDDEGNPITFTLINYGDSKPVVSSEDIPDTPSPSV